jgi:hypothetical protein
MLFHITQVHVPESCPRDDGGFKTLFNPDVKGLALVKVYGAFSEHKLHYVVEADNMEAVNKFLHPGLRRCSHVITPVIDQPF